MSKASRRRRGGQAVAFYPGRDDNSIARRSLHLGSSLPPLDSGLPEDRRTFYPGPADSRPYRTLYNRPARLSATPLRTPPSGGAPRPVFGPSWGVFYEEPSQVTHCVRRKRRKEVIHARGIAGTRVRRGRRNERSNYTCR